VPDEVARRSCTFVAGGERRRCISRRWDLHRAFLRAFSSIHTHLYELSGGTIGARVRAAPVLVLTTRGRRSGKLRTTPLLYLTDGERLVVVASNGGAPRNPGWFFNLEAHPDAVVQVRREHRRVQARRATAEERDRYWRQLVAIYPAYESYRAKTSREIPLVVLEPRDRVTDRNDQKPSYSPDS